MDMPAFSTSGKIIHVSVSDYLVYSFSVNGLNINTRCMVHQKTNPTAENETTVTGHNNYFASQPPIRALISTTNSFLHTTGSWFYLRCALNNETSKYFSYGAKLGVLYPATITENNIPLSVLLKSENINTVNRFQKIYTKSSTITVKVLNAALVGSPVYIKNLYILQEYIRETIEFQYL